MKICHICVRAILAASALLLFSATSISPDNNSEPAPPAPHPQEVVLLEELSSWIWGVPSDEELALFQQKDLVSAIRSRPQSFELFSGLRGTMESRALLETLPYGDQIWHIAERFELNGLLVAAVVEIESSFDAAAVSPRGALGLMQVMPATAHSYGIRDARDPRLNLEAGARYLGSLLRRYEGDLGLALAAYNAGPTNVARYGGVPPFPETARFVDKVLQLYVGHCQALWQASDVEPSALSDVVKRARQPVV